MSILWKSPFLEISISFSRIANHDQSTINKLFFFHILNFDEVVLT